MATAPSTQPQDHQQMPPPPPLDPEGQTKQAPEQKVEVVDFSKQGQWLRAAVLGANSGLLSTASLLMGVDAVCKDPKTMVITGVAGLIGGACSVAIGELISMCLQHDIETAQIKRANRNRTLVAEEVDVRKEKLRSPWQAAGVSALAFVVGALVPLLAAAFVKEYKVRLAVVVAVVSMALIGFSSLSAVLGKAPVVKWVFRVLAGGWVDMLITFGLTKLIGSAEYKS